MPDLDAIKALLRSVLVLLLVSSLMGVSAQKNVAEDLISDVPVLLGAQRVHSRSEQKQMSSKVPSWRGMRYLRAFKFIHIAWFIW